MKNVILSILAIAFVMFSVNAQTKKTQPKFSIDKIVTDYLALKNALIKDDNASKIIENYKKNKIIENLTKVIKSQEEEIAELKKENHLKTKRAWHY